MISKIQALIMDHLSVELKGDGFLMKRRQGGFVRRMAFGSQKFQLMSINYRSFLKIEAEASVRFDVVENCFHRTSGFDPKYHASTSTLGEFFYELGGSPGSKSDLIAYTQDDIPGVVHRLTEVFHEQAEPFFDRFGDLIAVDAALNSEPELRSPFAGGPAIFRCSKGLITARLLDRKDFSELETIYRQAVCRDGGGTRLPVFEALVCDLKNGGCDAS